MGYTEKCDIIHVYQKICKTEMEESLMRQQIEALRCEMKAEGIDAYIIPTTDFHGSEYVNEYFKC